MVYDKAWIVMTGDGFFLVNQPEYPLTDVSVLLAHGAGAPMDSGFMNVIAEGICDRGIPVRRFEFPYMQERRISGKKKFPDSGAALEEHFIRAIEEAGGAENCIIGGKSLGGRIASQLASRIPVKGLVCLGFPFHPPGHPEKLRTAHFADINVPNLLLQGTRDRFGTRDQVASYNLPENINISWLEAGDHDFKCTKRSGFSQEEYLKTVISLIASFVGRITTTVVRK